MFYVEKYINDNEIYVRDTKDLVLESYSKQNLISLINSYSVVIEGVSLYGIYPCSCFKLLNKDSTVGYFCIKGGSNSADFYYSAFETLGILPLDFNDIRSWITSRHIFTCARDIKQFFSSLGVKSDIDFITIFHCISLHDTFWVSPLVTDLSWLSVSPYHNDYSKFVSRYSLDGIIGKKDFNYLSPDIATLGSFPSTWRFKGVNNILYLKGSSKYTLGGVNSGDEPFSEYFCSKIADFLHFNHVNYTIRDYTRGDGKKDVITVCKSYTSDTIGSVTAHVLNLNSYSEVIEYCKLNLESASLETVLDMLFLDCVTLNTDRHFSNIEFLYNTETMKVLRVAPIFDNNFSLLPRFVIGVDTFVREDYTTRANESFESVFKLISAYKDFKPYLLKLKSFKLVNSKHCRVSDERLQFLNNFIQLQVDYFLKEC